MADRAVKRRVVAARGERAAAGKPVDEDQPRTAALVGDIDEIVDVELADSKVARVISPMKRLTASRISGVRPWRLTRLRSDGAGAAIGVDQPLRDEAAAKIGLDHAEQPLDEARPSRLAPLEGS